MKIAFVFPGQGSQSVGMAESLRQVFPICNSVFAEADSILGFELGALCTSGPADILATTSITQPAIFVSSIAALLALTDAGVRPDVVAGHSVGEYAAVVASGATKWQDALKLVQSRANAMDSAARANPGAMAAILGMPLDDIRKVCSDTENHGHGIVDCANVNSDAQIVISGQKAAVDFASKLALERGAKKAISLAVSGGFHSRLMSPAASEMASALENAPISNANIPIVANVTAEYEQSGTEIKLNLLKQIDHSVLWHQSVKRMIDDGVDTLVEVGSGKVLSGLLKRVSPDIKIYNTNDADALNEAVAAIVSGS